jgi:hypothetical protein
MKKITLAFLCVFAMSPLLKADSIVRVGACATPGYADGVYVQGQYAYIADRDGVTSIDIGNPSVPNVLDYLYEMRCQATGIFIKDTLAFVNSSLTGPTFTIIDIAKPESLTRISWVEVPGYGGITPKGIAVEDTICYYADSDGGFIIINIADLLNPTIICTMDTPGYVVDLFVKDTLAFIVDFDSLYIVNVSDPGSPFIIGRRWIIEGGYDVWVSGNYAFLTEDDYFDGIGLVHMIDVSDPTNPIDVRQHSMNAIPYSIFVLGDMVYIAADDYWYPPWSEKDGRADIEGGIRVFRWAEPDTLEMLLSFDTPGRCRDIFVVDSFIYVTIVDSFIIYKYISTGIAEDEKKSPPKTSSFVSYPNPFTKKTQISFSIPSNSFVSLEIYDTQGRGVKGLASGYFVPGRYEVTWDGRNNNRIRVTSGIYFAKLTTKSGMIRSEREGKIIYINERRKR